jgi:hypothetical protein
VTLRFQVAWLGGGNHEQESRESHADLAKASLTKEEGVKFQDFVGDHHGQARKCGYNGERVRTLVSISVGARVYPFFGFILTEPLSAAGHWFVGHLSSLQVS